MASMDYLEEERQKLWAEITQLKKDLKKKTSDYEAEAKQASKKSSEYRNNSLKAKDLILEMLSESESKLSEIQLKYEHISNLHVQIEGAGHVALESSSNIDSLQNKILILDELFEEHENLNEKLEKLTTISQEGEESSSKINSLYSTISKRKSEFDELYYEVMGYDEENKETAETQHIDGLKDELESAYTKIELKLTKLDTDISDMKVNAKLEFETTIQSWKDEYTALAKEVSGLLPRALTKGLSHAFSEKSKLEIEASKKLNKRFFWAILGLVIVSLIPFVFNIYLINVEGKNLESIITDIPRIALAILPMYLPFLWLAYSSNKKESLSKRLIEEYTHKEVLSKTFEGLSKQINDIENSEISEELRIKLLYNILEVSAENPGKLISDYNSADHPLMDALDKSVKLSDSVDRLANIPGFSKLTKILETKSNKLLKEQAKKANDALDSVMPDV